jgi:hypothetical protein
MDPRESAQVPASPDIEADGDELRSASDGRSKQGDYAGCFWASYNPSQVDRLRRDQVCIQVTVVVFLQTSDDEDAASGAVDYGFTVA